MQQPMIMVCAPGSKVERQSPHSPVLDAAVTVAGALSGTEAGAAAALVS